MVDIPGGHSGSGNVTLCMSCGHKIIIFYFIGADVSGLLKKSSAFNIVPLEPERLSILLFHDKTE